MQLRLLTTALLASVAFGAAAQAPGISKDQITVGTIQDLSGPIAAYGKQARNGMQMRADEINERGGVNGRKIKLVVEDHGYDPRRALLAAQKMVTQDKVFAILGHIGTPTNMAVMPFQFERGVINFFPLTGAREMFEPFHRLKFAFSPPYFDQMRTLVPQMVKDRGFKRVCALYQDDEFGLEVLRGAETGLKAAGIEMAEKTSYKRGATDFSSQVARLKAANCELVVLGTIVRETIGSVAEAKKTGYNPTFIGTTALYTHLIHQLGGKAMDGLYGVQVPSHPYPDAGSSLVRDWGKQYKAKFNEDPTVFSVYGYAIMDIFSRAAEKAGAKLTTDSFINVMETTTFPRDMFGNPEVRFSKNSRLGQPRARLAQIIDGKWQPVSDLVEVVRGD
ncbi:MAG TPA: ABC transporter substrate-binding protein [Burkholderiaceae bacterium]|nr:ABC transporter substrate-binding protein [Burkholderiaceae bacterium]